MFVLCPQVLCVTKSKKFRRNLFDDIKENLCLSFEANNKKKKDRGQINSSFCFQCNVALKCLFELDSTKKACLGALARQNFAAPPRLKTFFVWL